MINKIPENWDYSDDLEMLFMFYQSTDELLSEVSPDSYALHLHNALSLIDEIEEVYNLLEHHDNIVDYYERYISPIIDEFIQKIRDDYILKKMLGNRLDSIVTGFNESKTKHKLLKVWIDIFKQSCNRKRYRLLYEEEIIRLITETTEKNKLLYCVENYYIILINIGYSREYLYTSAKRFFNNSSFKINNKNQIKEFLNQFTCNSQRYNFLVLMDMENIEYLDNISGHSFSGNNIQKISVEDIRKEICEDYSVLELLNKYDKKKKESREYQKIEIVKIHKEELDPYKAAMSFTEYISFLQTFKRYFIHHSFSKQVFEFLLQKDDGRYIKIKIPNKIKKRPFVSQELIDSRIRNILSGTFLGKSAFLSIAQALAMHADAFDSKNTSTLFRSLWTALETLFSNTGSNTTRDNVVNSVLSIIQKTYILKIMRVIYAQITDAIDVEKLKQLQIQNFDSFVEYFASNDNKSEEMKKLFSLLSTNPLLRSRIYNMRKKLTDGKSIFNMLESHKLQIEWQLNRLYRIRNIATHLGTEITGSDIAINHLHSYFDYVVNYILCKTENGDYVPNISSLVFESKNDLKIHMEILKSKEPLSSTNYLEFLFGPDRHLINYQFEY